MPRIVRVGLLQAVTPGPLEPDISDSRKACIQLHLDLLEQASSLGIQVACFRELAFYPWFPASGNEAWKDLAEPVPQGPTTKLLLEKARSLGMILVVPIYETSSSGSLYSTTLVVDQDGELLGSYRKMHVAERPPWFRERSYYRPGNKGYPVFKTSQGNIGVYMGGDLLFPEGARLLGLSSADLVVMPSSWPSGPATATCRKLPSFHACTNSYFVAACNRAGPDPVAGAPVFAGQSQICDPRGTVLAQASREHSQLIWADLDLELARDLREEWAIYRDRRPATYQRLTRPQSLETRLHSFIPG